MNFKITKIDKTDKSRTTQCDAYITNLSTPDYSSSIWQNIIQNIYKQKTLRLCAINENNEIVGHCLVYYNQNDKCLYTPRFGLNGKTKDITHALCESITQYANEKKLHTSLITTGKTNHDLPGDTWTKTNMFIPLNNDDEESLWATIPKKTRNMIRKAEKSELSVIKQHSACNDFYPLYQTHMLSKRLRIKPIEYFKELETLGSDLTYFTLIENNAIKGFMIFSTNGGNASYLYNICNLDAAQSGGNNLMMWTAIQTFNAQGLNNIELGESSENSPVYNFKKRTSKNVEIIPIHYATTIESKPPINHRIQTIITGKMRALKNRAFPFMPQTLQTKTLQNQDKRGRVV